MRSIIVLSEPREPLIGGGQIYAKYLCEELVSDHNTKVEVLTRSFSDEEGNIFNEPIVYGPNFRLERIGTVGSFFSLPLRIIGIIQCTIALYKKVKKNHYDIIHAHALLRGIPARIVGLLTHTPVVYTVHGTMHMDTHKKGIHYFLEQLLVCWIQYDMIISVSHKVLNYNLSTKNVKVIYPGIDTHKFRLSHVTKKKDGKNFIFVGRIDWQKGLNFLISAIASIGKEKLISSGFHLNIVGDGPDRQKIEDQVSQAGIEKFISFKGKLIKQDVVDEYRANTIFILPSLAEGQPVVVMEAMCCKLPIIATDVGDNKNVIKSEFGMVVPSGNSEVLAEAITHYLDMGDKEIEQQGLAGYQEVIEHYDRKNIANQISEVFDELIQNYNKKVL